MAGEKGQGIGLNLCLISTAQRKKRNCEASHTTIAKMLRSDSQMKKAPVVYDAA